MPRETIRTPAVDTSSPWDRRLAILLSTVIFGVMVGVPLVILPGFSFYFDITPKVVILLLGTAAILPLWGAWAPGLARLLQGGRGRWFAAILAAQMLSLALSTVFSAQPELSFAGSNWRRLGLVTHGSLLIFTLALAGWLVSGANQVTRLLRAITAGGAVAGAYGALQYFGVEWFLPAEAYHEGEADWAIVRPPSTLGHAGYFAAYLLHVVFIALCVGKTDPLGGWRKLGLAVAGLSSVTVILSGTRAAILGLVVGAALLWFWYRPRLSWRPAVGAVAVAAVGMVFYFSPLGQKLRSRTDWSIDDVWGGARPWLWTDSLRMGVSHWATGTGLETFSSEYPRYQSIGLAQAYPNRYHESPHNMFLDAFTGQGAWGLAVLVLLVGVALLSAAQGRKSRTQAAGYLAAAFGAGLCSQQFFSWTVPTALYFYASLGLLVALALGEGENRPSATSKAALWHWPIVALVGMGLIGFALQLAAADRGMVRVKQHASGLRVEEAITAYEKVLRVKPWGMSADLWYSRLMALLAQQTDGVDVGSRARAWQAAVKAAQQAGRVSEVRQNAYYSLAAFHAVHNNGPGIEDSLRQAIAIAPNWYKPHWTLARTLEVAGRVDEARTEAKIAVHLNGGKDPEVAATWEQLKAEGDRPRRSK